MTDSTAGSSTLHRALGLRDLILLNIACIVGFSSLAQVAQFGFASLPLYVLAAITFLIPSGIMVAELNARMPEEGGFYLWTRQAFGDFHAYVAAWTYWLSNIVWLPTVLLLVSAACLYVGGEGWLSHVDDPWYNATVCLVALWGTTLLNIIGLERAKWIQNVGAVAVWLATLALVALGVVFVLRFGSVHPFEPAALVPDLGDFEVLPFFGIVAFCFGGLELAPVMAGEIREPRRNIPRALAWSAVAVVLVYMGGTLALIWTLPEKEVGIIDGASQAFFQIGAAFEAPWLGAAGAGLIALATMGAFGSWLTGIARIPFVIGLDHYLPDAVGRVHPRWGSPWVSLLMQAGVISALFLASIAGTTIKEGFLVLLDMSVILYFIPFLYMFAALVRHVRRETGAQGAFAWLRRPRWLWLVAGPGFGITLLSAVLSAVPSREIEDGPLFVLKVVGGAAVLIGGGLIVYWRRRA